MTWPQGVGGMVERVRDHDWSGSAIGAIGGWSAELRVAAMIVLEASLPAILVWGEERVTLHNDGFESLLDGNGGCPGRPFSALWPEIWPHLEPLAEEAFRGKASRASNVPFEMRRGGRAGTAYLSLTLSPVRDLANRVVGVICTVTDDTREVRAAAALRESEERLGFLLALSDALRPIEDEGRLLDVGLRLVSQRLRASRAVLLELDADGDTVRGVRVPSGDCPPSLRGRRLSDLGRSFAATLRGGRAATSEDAPADARLGSAGQALCRALRTRAFVLVPLFRRDLLRAVLCFDLEEARSWSAGEVRVVEAAAERIWAATERAASSGSLRRFAMLVESSHEFIALCDAEMRPSFLNAAALRMIGVPDMATAATLSLSALLSAEDAARLREDFLPRVRREGSGEIEMSLRPLRGGGPVWVICSMVVMADGYGIVAHDITDRKRAEAALLDSEERLRRFGEASSDALWIREADTMQWTYLTAAFETLYGLSRERVLTGDNLDGWASLILPEDRERALSLVDLVRRGEQVSFEYRVRRPDDGTVRWIRNTDFPMRDAAGRVRSIGGISRDVTALKETQEALADAERRQRVLVEGIPQLVWRADAQGRWTWVSPQWVEYTGLTARRSYGFGWLDAVHPDDRGRALGSWRGAVAETALDMETRLLSARQGRYRWFSTRALPVRDSGGGIAEWLGTSTDIDDLRQLQEEQKLLVAELQHRTRNLIGVIRSIADQTMARLGPTERFREAFRDRLSALSRVQGLLSLSGEERVTIGDVVRLELDALAAGSPGRVDVEGDPVPLRKAMVQTLALALHELATNARKYGALAQEGGRLRIRWMTARNEGDEVRLRLDWTESGVDMGAKRNGEEPGGGYGRELIERALPYALKARTSYELTHDGLRCTIDLPLGARREP